MFVICFVSILKDERGMQCRQFSIFEILLPLIFRVLGYEFLGVLAVFAI
jgi:hypothetical protein